MTNTCSNCKHCDFTPPDIGIRARHICTKFGKRTVHPVTGNSCFTGGVNCYDARGVDGHCGVEGKYFELNTSLSSNVRRIHDRFCELPPIVSAFVFVAGIFVIGCLFRILGAM